MGKDINIGIEFLRIILTFLIVANHFWYGGSYIWIYLKSIAVPSFMIISFYFMGSYLNKRETLSVGKIFSRIERLLVPFWGWGIFYFFVRSIFDRHLSFKSLVLQLLFGHTVCQPLYFIFCQIVIYIVLSFLIYHNKHISIHFLAIFSICILLQYTNINYMVLNKLPYSIKYPLGRLIELMPPAIIGLYLYKYLNKIKSQKLSINLVMLLIVIIAGGVLDYKFTISGFGYQGLGKLMGAVGITSLFILLPITISQPTGIRKISSLTLGIYCVHYFVGQTMKLLFNHFISADIIFYNLILNLSIFLLAFIISYFISITPIRNIEKLVK